MSYFTPSKEILSSCHDLFANLSQFKLFKLIVYVLWRQGSHFPSLLIILHVLKKQTQFHEHRSARQMYPLLLYLLCAWWPQGKERRPQLGSDPQEMIQKEHEQRFQKDWPQSISFSHWSMVEHNATLVSGIQHSDLTSPHVRLWSP